MKVTNGSDAGARARALPKVGTGNPGLDKILLGGLPAGRMTLLTGSAGCGKTIIGLEYLVRGAAAGEAGILVPFEERTEAVRTNALTLGWDLAALERERRLFIVEARPDYRTVISGNFDIKGLLTIIDGVARDIGARRLVLDAVDVLLRCYDNPAREREQLFLLNEWLMERGFTALVTVKRGEGSEGSSRYEFLDYLADCVIHLNQRVAHQVTTRRLRVVKYRGSDSGRNEYPYVTSAEGLKVIPISGVQLRHQPLDERLTSGHAAFDEVLGGGFFRGGCVLIAGASGTGKTTLASTFARAACARGERVLFLSFEESAESMVRCMMTSGTDLQPALDSGALRPLTAMPEALGAEEHLMRFVEALDQFSPHHVILETISAAIRMGPAQAAFEYVVRLMNACRERGTTTLFTDQTVSGQDEAAIAGKPFSSLVDAVVFLRYVEIGGEINRVLSVIKSRGSNHSNQLREFRITSRGVEILPVYTGEGGMLTGAARHEQEAREAAEGRRLRSSLEAKRKEILLRKAELEAESLRLLAAVQQAETELTGMEFDLAKREEVRTERGSMRRGSSAFDHRTAPPAGFGNVSVAPDAKAKYNMMLFVAGDETNSQAARANLQKICDQYLPGRAGVEIVDVLADYRKALEFSVLITPALVLLHPPPMARIVGTLENTEAILTALRLSSEGQRP